MIKLITGCHLRFLINTTESCLNVLFASQFEYEKWKMSTGNLVMLYSVPMQKPLRINRDASVDACGDYTDPAGRCF